MLLCHSFNSNNIIGIYYAVMYFLGQEKEEKLSLQNWTEIIIYLKVYVLSLWIRFKHNVYNLKWALMNFYSESCLGDVRYFVHFL